MNSERTGKTKKKCACTQCKGRRSSNGRIGSFFKYFGTQFEGGFFMPLICFLVLSGIIRLGKNCGYQTLIIILQAIFICFSI